MQICGISCVTNMAAGMSENPLSHQEVQENAAKAAPYIRRLLHESVLKMHKELNK
jgi:purine-nucleoside phosphorylase